MTSPGQKLAFVGIFIPPVFWLTLAVCGELLGGYRHGSDLVSELGAEGTATRWLFASGLLACSALSVAFVAGLLLECRKAALGVLPVLLILSFTITIAGAAIFPMPQPMHGRFGAPFALMMLSPPLALVSWRRDGHALPGLRGFAVASFALMAAGALVFVPDVLGQYPGLKQRFMHAGWSVWFTYLGAAFSGIMRSGRGHLIR